VEDFNVKLLMNLAVQESKLHIPRFG